MPSTIGKCKIKHNTLFRGRNIFKNQTQSCIFFEINCTFYGRKENNISLLISAFEIAYCGLWEQRLNFLFNDVVLSWFLMNRWRMEKKTFLKKIYLKLLFIHCWNTERSRFRFSWKGAQNKTAFPIQMEKLHEFCEQKEKQKKQKKNMKKKT